MPKLVALSFQAMPPGKGTTQSLADSQSWRYGVRLPVTVKSAREEGVGQREPKALQTIPLENAVD